ncbi:MAG: hypothetical protein M1817_005619 [Caeruleum heppii]|nr:MAG: hypothetical protein M1817_005619 [Caeruleum heppii]
MSNGKVVEGVLAINKPASISSAQVLRDLQKHFNPSNLFSASLAAERDRRARENGHQQRRRRRDNRTPQVKIGHGGTLDPLATGVLIAGIGKGTKSLQRFLACTKTYEATVLFGVATDSYDRLGKIIGRAAYEHVTREGVDEALQKFRGKIMQKPPIFSALSVNGKRLYEYAREGKELPREIEARPVEVLKLELVEWMDGGTHDHRWPEEEAPQEEKAVAEKVLHLGHSILQQQSGSKPAPTRAIESEHRTPNRKRSHDAMDKLVTETVPKRPRTSAGPMMSGALADPSTSVTSETTIPSSATKSATSSDQTDKAPFISAPTSTPDRSSPRPPAARLLITSTSGFYVRSLCHDLGAAVGSLALMSELVRTRQGPFELGRNTLEYADLEKGEEVWADKVEGMLRWWGEAGEKEGAHEASETVDREGGRAGEPRVDK